MKTAIFQEYFLDKMAYATLMVVATMVAIIQIGLMFQ